MRNAELLFLTVRMQFGKVDKLVASHKNKGSNENM